MSNSEQKLIIIEHDYQINNFVKYFKEKNFKDDYSILALNLSAQIELRRRNISFYNSSDFFKNHDQILLIETATKMTKILREDFNLTDAHGICKAYEIDFLRIFNFHFLNYCLSQILIIHNAVSLLNPSVLILPRTIEIKDAKRNLDHNTSFIGALGKLYVESNKLEFILEGARERNEKDSSNLYDFLARLIFSLQLIFFKYFSFKKKVIWATSASYNIPRFVNQLKIKITPNFIIGISNSQGYKKFLSLFTGKNWNFYKFPPPTSKKELNNFYINYDQVVDRLESKMKKNENVFLFKNISLREIILDFFKNSLRNQIKYTFYGSHAFDKVINIKRPTFVISNQVSSYHYAIGEHCRIKNLDALLVSHGTHVLNNKKIVNDIWTEHSRYMILSEFPYVSLQTPYTEQFLKEKANLVSSQIKTGPLIFAEKKSKSERERLRKKLFPNYLNKKILLHAATPYSWSYLLPYINLTQEEYIKNINDLIKTVKNMKNVFLIIRIRLKSFPGLSLKDLKSLLVQSESFDICVDESFEELLAISDLLISYSSTAIEEALQSDIPVLQYDPHDRYSHIEGVNMKKNNNIEPSSVYYVGSEEDLSWSLKWIINNHLYKNPAELKKDWEVHKLNPEKNWLDKILKKNN